jgi:type IV secretory pathway VirB10-like protein
MNKIARAWIAVSLIGVLGSTVAAAQQEKPTPESEKTERAEKARETQEKLRQQSQDPKAKTRPEPAKPVPAPAAKPAPTTTTDEHRAIAKKAAHFEAVHRERQARMNRLIRIYKEKGDAAKVAKLEEMKAKENTRTENAMAGYRKQLGEENWGRVNSEIKKHHGRDEHADKRQTNEKEKEREKERSGGTR